MIVMNREKNCFLQVNCFQFVCRRFESNDYACSYNCSSQVSCDQFVVGLSLMCSIFVFSWLGPVCLLFVLDFDLCIFPVVIGLVFDSISVAVGKTHL